MNQTSPSNIWDTPKMSSQKKWDLRMLDIAKSVSTWSKDPSTQCGAVITDSRRRLISVGYNGFPRDMPDAPELYADRNEKYSRIIHCEVNALNAASGKSVEGATLYTWPCISCDRCFVQMVQEGLTRFVAPEVTEDMKSRWGPALARVRSYMVEINLERISKGLPALEMIEYPDLHSVEDYIVLEGFYDTREVRIVGCQEGGKLPDVGTRLIRK